MILLIILALIILASTALYYQCVIKPKKLIQFYVKAFSPTFKVFVYPFTPFKASQFEIVAKMQKKSQDCFSFTKEVVSEFDVAIANIANHIQINLVSPKLMQAFHELDQERYYRKFELIISGLRSMVGTGLTFSVGDEWKIKRRITTKMLNFNYISSLVPKVQTITDSKADELIAVKPKQLNGFTTIDILELTTNIASTVVLQLFFGGGQRNVNDLKIQDITVNHYLRKLLYKLQIQCLDPLALILGQKFTKLGVRQLDRDVNQLLFNFKKFTKQYVQERLQQLKIAYQFGKNEPEVYTDLIEAFYVQEIIKKKERVTDKFVQSIVDDFATLYTAGTDTTSHASQMTLYYILSHPEVLNKLRQEISKNIPKIEELNYQCFKKTFFLEATILEALRMYSSANGIFPREAIEDHWLTIGPDIKIPIKKGTIVNTQTISTHYKASLYPNPNEFKPERFLDADGKISPPQSFALMNFSAGHRSCIGRQLAMTQIKVILATLLSNFQFTLIDSQKKMVFEEFAYNLKNVNFGIKRKN